MTALIGYQRVEAPEDVAGVLQDYTHVCGYTRAWRDTFDEKVVWFLPDCPADSVIAMVKQIITGLVPSAIETATIVSGPDIDIHARMLNVITGVYDPVVKWLNDKNTTEEIAQFIIGGNRLRGYIIDELIAQGYIA